MKKIQSGILIALVIMLASCEDFTDIQPKGENLLQTTDEIELLLNYEYYAGNSDMNIVCGDMIYCYSNAASQISQPTKTRNVIMWTFDEDNMDKMAELTSSDYDYADYYGYIGTIANPVLQQIDGATGSEEAKLKLKCEALALRAWCYYILVNKFAKAYTPETASETPGIIIMTEDDDITVSKGQSTVAEVYDQILSDINQAIDLGGLPEENVNKMRFSLPAAYAVKAMALMCMQQWDEAEEAAKKAIAINGHINDYTTEYLGTTMGYYLGYTYEVIERGREATEEDYFLNPYREFFNAYSPETWGNFEEGHVYGEKMSIDLMKYDYLMGMADYYLGESGWIYTYDVTSYWNDAGPRSPYMYLIIAECELHNGNINTSMQYLDMLRQCRIDPDVYEPLEGNVSTMADAIAHVRQVASNEHIYSSTSFIEKKRWNQIDGWEASYSRTIGGITYTMEPDNKMWVFPFPANVMSNNDKIQQNYNQ